MSLLVRLLARWPRDELLTAFCVPSWSIVQLQQTKTSKHRGCSHVASTTQRKLHFRNGTVQQHAGWCCRGVFVLSNSHHEVVAKMAEMDQ